MEIAQPQLSIATCITQDQILLDAGPRGEEILKQPYCARYFTEFENSALFSMAIEKRAGFLNSVKNRAQQSCSNNYFALAKSYKSLSP